MDVTYNRQLQAGAVIELRFDDRPELVKVVHETNGGVTVILYKEGGQTDKVAELLWVSGEE